MGTKRNRILSVRSMSSRELHGIAMSFDNKRQTMDLSARQEWLYDVVVDELERRHKATRHILERCWCRYCCNPFPDFDQPEMPF
jgi:hypothetical protein